MQVPAGSINVQMSLYCRSVTGTALTGKVAADFALTYRRDGVNVAIVLADLTALSDDHTEGGIKEVGNSEYRLDLPDAAVAAGVTQVTVNGTVAGGVVLGYPIALDTSPSAGTGARSVVFTVTDAVTLAAIQDATVRLYRTGSLDRVGTTDASGQVTLYCDVDATWSYIVTYPTYDSSSGTVVVDGNEAVPVELSTTYSTPSTDADSVTVRWRVKKTNRAWAGLNEATIYIQIIDGPGTDGIIWHGDNSDFDSQTTNASGYVEFTNVPVPCTLGVRTGSGRQLKIIDIPADAADPYDAGELVSYDA